VGGRSPQALIDLLWVVWDGASFDVVRRLMEAGELPTLARVSGDRVIPLAPLVPNCQTPPSLATLFTGGSIAEHGVSGFRVPTYSPGASFVDSRSGFERSLVRRPLLWDELAATGMRPGLCHVPWTSQAGGDTVVIHAYEHELARPGLVELAGGIALDLGGGRVVVRELEGGRYEARSEATGSRVCVTGSPDLDFCPDPLRLGPGLATRLAVLSTPRGDLLIHSGLWELQTQPADLRQALDAAVGAFVGKTLGDAYHAGQLGQRGTEGGGSAEEALLRSARLQLECFTRCFEVLLGSGLPDGLVVCYLPTLDELQHELFRWHGDGSTRWEALRRGYRLADEHLARLLARLAPGARVVVSSDHGAAVLRRLYHPNQTLARAGLLRFDDRGLIDVSSSRVAYHPAGNGSVHVNGVERAHGIVAEASRPAVVDAAEAVLQAVRDPATGQPPIEVRRVPAAERDLLGDLFIGPRPGYECSWRSGPSGDEFEDSPKGGTHLSPTGETSLRGMLATAEGEPGEGMTLMDVHSLVARLVSR
jgi:predicted AlkP superfamily phosphohydrolase/phosphomutase